MKNIFVNKTELKLIAGQDISYIFPKEKYKAKDGSEKTRTPKQSLYDIMVATPNEKVRSFDDRFDGKHPIELSVEKINSDGLSRRTLHQIFTNNPCIKSTKLSGKFKVLSELITEEQVKQITDRLKLEKKIQEQNRKNKI